MTNELKWVLLWIENTKVILGFTFKLLKWARTAWKISGLLRPSACLTAHGLSWLHRWSSPSRGFGKSLKKSSAVRKVLVWMCSRVVQLRFPNLPYGLTVIFRVRIPKQLHLQASFSVPFRRDRIVVAYQIQATDSASCDPASADGRVSGVECVQTEKRGGRILSSSASLLFRSRLT